MFQQNLQVPNPQSKFMLVNGFDNADGNTSTVLDPQSPTACRWRMILLAASISSLLVDPLFLYSPHSSSELCIDDSDWTLDVLLTTLRSVLDVFYLINILVQFRTAYVMPHSRTLGRGELVIDPWKISVRYLRKSFWLDVVAALPVPQVIIWAIIPYVNGSATSLSKTAPRFIILIPCFLRLTLLHPLSLNISKSTGAMPKNDWTAALYNLMLFYLFSHVTGSAYYLLSLQGQEACWKKTCDAELQACDYVFFDCRSINDFRRRSWLPSTNVTNICDPTNNFYRFGVYQPSLQVGISSATFLRKYFYCLFWSFQNLCAIWNNMTASSTVVENIFTNLFSVLGLLLFASLLGNVRMYLDSSTRRLLRWRIKRADSDIWMHHNNVDSKLRQLVRSYDQYKWLATSGVDEEALCSDLPPYLRRKVHRHLWFDLLRQVPIIRQMDDDMLYAICERLKPDISIEGAILMIEGHHVTKMVFIIRGNLLSYTSGVQGWVLNTSLLGAGNFCGDELLTWALDSESSSLLPSSTQTVQAISAVETLHLSPEDLKYIALQFKKLRSSKILNIVRTHSHQWRTWAACYIQAVWRSYTRKKKLSEEIEKNDSNSTGRRNGNIPAAARVILCS